MNFRGESKPTNPAMPALPASLSVARVPVLTILIGEMPGRIFRLEGESMVIGRLPECEVQLGEGGVSRMHARIAVSSLGVDIYDLSSTNGTFVNGERISQHPLRNGDKIRFGSTAVLRFNLQDELDEAFQREQFQKMTRDPLTGCHNRLYFDEALKRENAFAKRNGADLSLAMIDVDHFKYVNDTHGHSVGDLVLRELGQILYGQLRTYDILGRYGGEEFVALLRDAKMAGASVVAERLRAAVAASPFDIDGVSVPITVSVGVASASELPTRDPQALMRLADHRLYAAKTAGRNRVVSTGGDAARSRTEPVDQAAARAAIALRQQAARELTGAFVVQDDTILADASHGTASADRASVDGASADRASASEATPKKSCDSAQSHRRYENEAPPLRRKPS